MRLRFALMLAAAALHLPGCSDNSNGEMSESESVALATTTRVVATSVRRQVNLQFPADWEEQSDPAPFNSFWTYDPVQLTTGVFLYTDHDNSDLPPDETLQFHVDQIESNHRDFKVVRERSDTSFVPGTLATLVCSGVTSTGDEAFYRLTLVQFTDRTSPFVVVVQGCAPDVFDQAEPVFQQIINSIRPTAESAIPTIPAPIPAN